LGFRSHRPNRFDRPRLAISCEIAGAAGGLPALLGNRPGHVNRNYATRSASITVRMNYMAITTHPISPTRILLKRILILERRMRIVSSFETGITAGL
jgi:hypothetical protein